MARALARMGVPPDIQGRTSWAQIGDTALPRRARPELQALRRWVGDPHRPSLLLVGDKGVGKTCAALCCVRALLARGERARLAFAPELFARLFDDDLWQPCVDAPILALDDLGSEVDPNERAVERFFWLIDSRWRLRAPTLITTNLEHQSRTWLARRYGPKTADRLLDPAWLRVLTWSTKASRRR